MTTDRDDLLDRLASELEVAPDPALTARIRVEVFSALAFRPPALRSLGFVPLAACAAAVVMLAITAVVWRPLAPALGGTPSATESDQSGHAASSTAAAVMPSLQGSLEDENGRSLEAPVEDRRTRRQSEAFKPAAASSHAGAVVLSVDDAIVVMTDQPEVLRRLWARAALHGGQAERSSPPASLPLEDLTVAPLGVTPIAVSSVTSTAGGASPVIRRAVDAVGRSAR